ncbi:hypothetical protein [uncultured Lamprocystis sp.]|jgi:hypothetical protein|uniref:hypothetical protein n=1 Tax=uncultured Lamprocystis sp. TaxID=543132 RepID=UPI0025EEFED0|nr:hypothetical protein [uncultured Lamprocystis sp.]
MSDPLRWPALSGAAALLGEVLCCEIGIWGKVHRQASDYRWIARSSGFAGQAPDLHRRLRIGSEDRAARATAWRAPWEPAGQDYFAIGTYASRALDAAQRAGVLEKQVLHWHRPSAEVPAALAALLLLPAVAHADDRPWWDRVSEGDWQRPDYALPLGADACPRLRIARADLEAAVAAGIDALLEALAPPSVAALYAGLLAGVRPVMLRGQASPLPPAALATLLLPLTAEQAGRLSLSAWVPAVLIDPSDLAHNWDLVVTGQSGAAPEVASEFMERGAVLAQALMNRDPECLGAGSPGRMRAASAAAFEPPDPVDPGSRHLTQPLRPHGTPIDSAESGGHPRRIQLALSAAVEPPGLRYLYRFADRIALRRLDLSLLASDLIEAGGRSLLAPGEDPAGHPLIGWIETLRETLPAGVDAAEWGIKIDQLRAAALFLLPHPHTLALVGLPDHPRVPALLCALAAEPGAAEALAAHGELALRRMIEHSLACPDASLVADIRGWVTAWLAGPGNALLGHALRDLLLAE